MKGPSVQNLLSETSACVEELSVCVSVPATRWPHPGHLGSNKLLIGLGVGENADFS